MASVKIIGAGAYLTPSGADGPRPIGHGETVNVDQAEAEALVADGIAVFTDAVTQESAGESEVEDQYSEMDLAQLRAAAAERGIEGMERATTKTVLAALREQESAGESETRIGSGERR